MSRSTSRKGRGPTRGKAVEKMVEANGKLRVEIPNGVNVPVGKNAQRCINEMGALARAFVPITVTLWNDLSDDMRAPIIARLRVIILILLYSLLI